MFIKKYILLILTLGCATMGCNLYSMKQKQKKINHKQQKKKTKKRNQPQSYAAMILLSIQPTQPAYRPNLGSFNEFPKFVKKKKKTVAQTATNKPRTRNKQSLFGNLQQRNSAFFSFSFKRKKKKKQTKSSNLNQPQTLIPSKQNFFPLIPTEAKKKIILPQNSTPSMRDKQKERLTLKIQNYSTNETNRALEDEYSKEQFDRDRQYDKIYDPKSNPITTNKPIRPPSTASKAEDPKVLQWSRLCYLATSPSLNAKCSADDWSTKQDPYQDKEI